MESVEGSGEAGRGRAEDALRAALRGIAAPLVPSAGTVDGVLGRARGARRRRWAVRGAVAAAVFVSGALLAGPLVHERYERAEARKAAPPAAVVNLATAYPLAEGPLRRNPAARVQRPVNALAWPARGVLLPSQVTVLAEGYLASRGGAGVSSAVVEQLWAAQDVGRGVSFVLQGWTVGGSGVSRAVVLAGDYTPGSGRITMYQAPLRFAHPAPGERAGADDVRDVAELSVWSPESNRLVVLGAPQVTQVLYARDGRTLVQEPTVDGVAVFTRHAGRGGGRGGSGQDSVQVRDARNRALTPPGAWSVADVVLSGDAAVFEGGEWRVAQARGPGASAATPATAATRSRGASGASGAPSR